MFNHVEITVQNVGDKMEDNIDNILELPNVSLNIPPKLSVFKKNNNSIVFHNCVGYLDIAG